MPECINRKNVFGQGEHCCGRQRSLTDSNVMTNSPHYQGERKIRIFYCDILAEENMQYPTGEKDEQNKAKSLRDVFFQSFSSVPHSKGRKPERKNQEGRNMYMGGGKTKLTLTLWGRKDLQILCSGGKQAFWEICPIHYLWAYARLVIGDVFCS